MLESYLTLVNSVRVLRKTSTVDGMGGVTISTLSTLLPRALLWSPTQAQSYVSEKLARISSHILVTIPSYYAFNQYDTEITYNSETYMIKGYDDVMNMGEIMVVGLEKIV